MKTMKVKVLEERLKFTDPGTGLFHSCERDDQITVSAAWGEKMCCDLGWVEDLSGKLETCERKPGAVKLDVSNLKVSPRSGPKKKAGG